jgi:hypothetical protein
MNITDLYIKRQLHRMLQNFVPEMTFDQTLMLLNRLEELMKVGFVPMPLPNIDTGYPFGKSYFGDRLTTVSDHSTPYREVYVGDFPPGSGGAGGGSFTLNNRAAIDAVNNRNRNNGGTITY